MEKIPEGSFVLIDLVRTDFIDQDVVEVINHFLKHAHLKNIKVEIKKNITRVSHQLVLAQPIINS